VSQDHKYGSHSGSSTAEAPRPEDSSEYTSDKINSFDAYSVRQEARNLLDEIAGVHPTRRKTRSKHYSGKQLGNFLFAPFVLLLTFLKLIFRPITRLDFKLFHEIRRFLANPGHFFWFNRLAPEAAKEHFGTNTTEAMINHVRRYSAHIAVVGLALVVVAGGGFSGAVRQIINPEAHLPVSGQLSDGSFLTVTGNMKGIVLNSLGTTAAGTKRVKVYTVQSGDTIRDLATKNNISIDTILYANQIDDPDQELKIGEKLIVPPISGMWHVATRSSFQIDTIATIAAKYGVEPQKIIEYTPNQLQGVDINTPLQPGQDILVPDGVKPLRENLLVYKVREGEDMQYIAEKFGISRETIAIFNGPDGAPLQEVKAGMEITILPVSGIRVRVLQGDTVTRIADRFKAPVDNIIGLPINNLQSKDTPLKVGDWLIVPDGRVPIITATRSTGSNNTSSGNTGTGNIRGATESSRYVYIPPPPKPASSQSSSTGALSAAPPGAPVGTTGSMIWPMRGIITTYFGQPIWYGIHQGLDIAAPVNTPIVAADGGIVTHAGWSNDGYGNMVMIRHSNGLYTLYGHLNVVNVRVGMQVAQGQLLGLEGSTGNSTGPHLHFEVRWGLIYGQTYNPLRYLR
jgi:murein DD-endopeptidase MepM/ murein hydrolase activator NlpD